MHADAVIGTNNQFYNNQPVNTTDAAVGAIADIANLEPVKYLAHSTKLVGRAARMGLKKTAPGIAYQGFKKGIHNRYIDAIDGKIAQLVKNGVIKTGKAASKIPLGTVAGSVIGAEAGYAASDGSGLGASIGATLGAVSGTALHVGLKTLGIEPRISKAYQAVREFATRVPSAWMKAATVGKTGLNIATRLGVDTASEMMQEGVQARTSLAEPEYDV
jgi:hypothetical protein